MGPKKKEGAAGDAEVLGEDPIVLLQNYQKFCKSIGIAANTQVAKQLQDEEHYPVEQFVIDDENGAIGPGGTRALMTAVMGSGAGMKGGPYKLLKSIRIWRSNIGDGGAQAVAEVLRSGGAEVQLSYLELYDDNVGPVGAMALGQSLSFGGNLSLLTLKLDYNSTLGSKGIVALCRGLRSNITLKQLHVQFCQIYGDQEGAGEALGQLLQNNNSALEVLNLAGNRLGGLGLSSLCRGLMVNKKLTNLSLSDNMIDALPDDLAGLSSLRDVLQGNPESALTHVDLMYNRIGEAGANILKAALGPENTKIQEFLVDLTLPLPIFEQIFRRDLGGKGKKGKKGKKKK